MTQLYLICTVLFAFLAVVTTTTSTTVSEAYARDIQTPEHGCGMETVIQAHRHRLTGILNGIDYSQWDPSRIETLP